MKAWAVGVLVWLLGALGVAVIALVCFIVLMCRALREWLDERGDDF